MNPVRIVVVDDNTADINLLRLALDQQDEPYELEALAGGEEALRFVQAHREGSCEFQPCVILLDLHLPKYDGLAILKAIKQAPELAHIQVVVLSGIASPSEREQIAALGAFYRQKPFGLSDYMDLGVEVLAICSGSTAVAA